MRLHLSVVCVLGAAAAALIVAQAALLAEVIARAAQDRATLAQLRSPLIALAAVLAGRALVAGGFELSGRLAATRTMSQLRASLAERLLLVCPAGLPGTWRTGDLATAAVQGVDALEAWFAGYLPQLVLATLVPVAVLAWVVALDPIVAALLAVTVPVLIAFTVLVGKGARDRAAARYGALSLLGAHFLDVVRGLPTLIVHRRERAQAQTLAQVGERYRAESMATLRVAFLSALVLELCAMIGTALAAATIGVQLVAGALSLQAGLTVLLLAPELYAPLRALGAQFHAGADSESAAERIFAALDLPPAVAMPVEGPAGLAHADGAAAAPALRGSSAAIRGQPPQRGGVSSGRASRAADRRACPDPARHPISLRSVAYAYPNREALALSGLDLDLLPGQTTALVGPSGVGKSTVAKLLLGLLRPSAGTISCDGHDLSELDAESWRERIAWVPQRPHLFAGSIAENVRLAAPTASDEQLRAALHDAGADELLAKLPHGLDTPVGEGGRRLSAGQRQRIALARAFLRPASLLVLDEPTSHLDEAGAAQLAETIARLARGRTVLLIVHQPRLARRAERIVRLAPARVTA